MSLNIATIVVVEYYPENYKTQNYMTQWQNILALQAHFVHYGIPNSLVLDNGPSVQVRHLKKTITLNSALAVYTIYPQANGISEQTVAT